MTLFPQTNYHLIVAQGGGRYIGVERGAVIFEDPEDGYRMRLFTSWCKAPQDVADAIRSHRNFVKDFPAWERVEK